MLGKAVTVGKVRGDILETPDGVKALVTVHPSYLLRLPDNEAQQREYAKFVDDLKIVARALKGLAKDSAQAASIAPLTPASRSIDHAFCIAAARNSSIVRAALIACGSSRQCRIAGLPDASARSKAGANCSVVSTRSPCPP